MFQKIKKILIYTFFILLGLIIAFLVALQTSGFQSFLINKTTNYIYENYDLKTNISNINMSLPHTVELDDFVVYDHHSDTLSHIGQLNIDINKPYELSQIIDLKNISLKNGKFKLETYPGDSLSNLSLILKKFESTDTTSSSLNINLEELNVSNFEFTLKDTGQNLSFRTAHLNIEDFILNDTLTSLKLVNSDLEYKEVVKTHSLNGEFRIINGLTMELNDFSLASGNSHLETYAKIQFQDKEMDWLDYKTKYDLDIKSLRLDKNDINLEEFKTYIPYVVDLSGQISGTGKSLVVDKFILKTNESVANLSGRVKYPFKSKKINLKLNFNTLDIDKELAAFYLKDLSISENLTPLFPLHYHGLYKGNFIYNESKGNFRTAIGDINTDIQILLEDKGKNAIYFANLDIDKFELNTLLKNDDLGSSTMKINIDGEGFDWEKLKVKVEANIQSFAYKNYIYKNVVSDGNVEKDRYSGQLAVQDSNLSINFNGLVDLRPNSKQLDFKAQIDHLDLQALNLSDSLQTYSTNIDVRLSDIDIDKADGNLLISNFKMKNENGEFAIDSFYVQTLQKNEKKRVLKIESEILDLLATGDFKLLEFPDLIQEQIIPFIDYNQSRIKHSNQDLVLNANFKDTEKLTQVFIPELYLAKNSKLQINKTYTGIPELKFNSKYVVYADKAFKGLNLDIGQKDTLLTVNLFVDEIDLRTENFKVSNVSLKNDINRNNINSKIKWQADFDSTNYSGFVDMGTHLDSNFNINAMLKPSSQLFMADSLWGIKGNNKIAYNENGFSVMDLKIFAKSQSLVINSILGNDSNSYAQVDFGRFKLSNLNPYLIKNDTKIEGEINGAVSLNNISTNLEIESLLTLDSTIVNDIYLGNIVAYSYHDEDENKAGFDIDITRGTNKPIVAKLEYDIDKGLSSFDLVADVNKLRVDYADPYVNEWVKDLKGRISGHITMTKDTILSNFSFEKIGFNIPSIGTRYNIEGKPKFFVNNHKFAIPEFKLNVINKNEKETSKFGQAVLSGNLYHKNFVDYIYDIKINFKNFLCLSTTEESENIFYGDAVISGDLDMTGENSSPIIKIDASTSKGTKLTLAYSDLSEINEETFIRFKQPKIDTVVEEKIFKEKEEVSDDKLEIDLNLKVNPSSIVTFNVDESVLTGRGIGDLNFKFNSNLDFDLYGNYVVEQADYMFAFTTGLVEAKKFDIEKGGKVIWNGDAMKGLMDIKAQYNSNLPSIDPKESKNKDVHSIINLKGELLKPEVEFAIEIPTATDEEQILLNNYTNSEEKLAKQFLSILIMNSFYVEENGIIQNASNQLVSSTAGLLTSQLNKWLNETQSEFDMGFRINPGTGGDLNSQEVEFFLSKNLLDDRLRLNGNLGTPIGFNTSRVKGNFELEYDVKKDGKLKLRVFSRTGENSSEQNTQNSQGLGLFYRLEYDRIFGFLRKKRPLNED